MGRRRWRSGTWGMRRCCSRAPAVRVLTDPFLRDASGRWSGTARCPSRATSATWTSCSSRTGIRTISIGRRWPTLGGAPTVVVPRGLGVAARQAVRGEVMELAAGERLEVAGVGSGGPGARIGSRPGRRAHSHWATCWTRVTRLVRGRHRRGSTAMRELARRRRRGAAAGVDVGPASWARPPRPPVSGGGARRHPARVAIPIHWGTLYPRRLHRVWRRPLTEPGDRFAAHAARLAPATTVRVLRPGEATTIEATG